MSSLRRGCAAMLIGGAICQPALAQQDVAPAEGLRDNTPRVHALTDVRIVVGPGEVIERGSIVLRDGLIESVGANIDIPGAAKRWRLAGRTVYAGLIDPMSSHAVPAAMLPPPPPDPQAPPPPPEAPASGPRYWNPRIHPEWRIAAELGLDEDAAAELRELGFTSVLAVPQRGILRGQSALLNLHDGDDAARNVVAADVAQHAGTEISVFPLSTDYPGSMMGVLALLRQAFYDARWQLDIEAWYANRPQIERPAVNLSLAALAPAIRREQSIVFETRDELDYARAKRLADEFGLQLLLLGNGYEYRRADELAAAGLPLILPLAFPEPPAIETPELALDVPLAELEHWELAASNPAILARTGIPIALTAFGLESPASEFWPAVRRAVRRGLAAEAALAALTIQPAQMLGLGERLGSVKAGRIANLIVSRGDPFNEAQAVIEQVWIDGVRYATDAGRRLDPRGRWALSFDGAEAVIWPIVGASAGRAELDWDGVHYPVRAEPERLLIFPDAAIVPGSSERGTARLSARYRDGRLDGLAELPSGRRLRFAGERIEGPPPAKVDEPVEDARPALERRRYPAGAYGVDGLPAQPIVLLVRGATLWTGAPDGPLESADLLVRAGRIAAVGSDLDAPAGAEVVEATGKHVTAGLIDAHSHTAGSGGLNEFGSAVSLEVRIRDVLNPTDINIYRELAGGVTSANVLHGSANPMGGQNQIIKLRWGADAAGLVFDGAPPGVKFALGENVKQSNWGDRYTSRYPQTRMGVGELMRDTFNAAEEYRQALLASRGRNQPPVRRNLRLDAALEILDRRRVIHIHSYRQDEILMFARLARELGLAVATFQHVLEGYKVPEAIAEIGAGASTFSDWWAYKLEVYDAIPYNGALMQRAGVVTSFNSDSDELARRLNTEAAKAVRYGGLSQSEALALVTANPARQLGIDGRVGSLEPGKDADFVIWSGHPLSTASRAEQTWIDGRRYFDLATDARLRRRAESERARLIQLALPHRLRALEKSGSDRADQPEQRRNAQLYTSTAGLSCADEGILP